MKRLAIELKSQVVAVDVDEAMTVGTCAASFAAHCGWPLSDAAGRPLGFSLRPKDALKPLPIDARIGDLPLVEGTPLVLDLCPSSPEVGGPGARMSRRTLLLYVLLWGTAGLTAGLATAFAQRALLRPTTSHLMGKMKVQLAPTPSTPSLQLVRQQVFFAGTTLRALAWSPDGQFLAGGGEDGRLLLWSLDGLQRLVVNHPAPVSALAWSPNGERLVTAADRQAQFLTREGAVLARLTHHTAPISSLAWSSHGEQQVVSGGLDRLAVVWDSTSYRARLVFRGHGAPITAVSWASDGRTVASSSFGGVVRVWRADTGQEIHPPYRDAALAMRTLSFVPGGMTLAVGGDDGVVRLWDALACQQVASNEGVAVCQDTPVRLRMAGEPLLTLAWSPTGHYLACGNQQGVLSLWDPGQPGSPLSAVSLGTPIMGLSWSPDGQRLAVAVGARIDLWSLG